MFVNCSSEMFEAIRQEMARPAPNRTHVLGLLALSALEWGGDYDAGRAANGMAEIELRVVLDGNGRKT